MHPYSQSAVTTDWSCPRKRYLQYHAGGAGYESPEGSIELYLGIVMHDALAAIAYGKDIETIAKLVQEDVHAALMGEYAEFNDKEDYALEQACLMEGLVRGFYRHAWPKLMAQFPEIVHVERKFLYLHDAEGKVTLDGPFRFAFIPDLLVRDKDGLLVYLEYKTTSSIKDEWMNSWKTSIQLHSTALAAESMLGEPIEYMVIQGLHKGYYSQYNRQESPLCYGYLMPGNPPFTKDQWSMDWKKGYNKSAIWRRDGGVKGWIDNMNEYQLAGQFPQVPMIVPNRELAETFFRQQTFREGQIKAALENITPLTLDQTFPQHWDKCQASFGKPCGFRTICHGSISNPLEHGFTLRVRREDKVSSGPTA